MKIISHKPGDYYYGDEADQYAFYRFPKALFSAYYVTLPDGSKILYGLMLDRMGLSRKNGWIDGAGRVYIYFTVEDVMEYLNCGHDKALKLLAALDTKGGAGLIERVRQGQGKPAKIYLRKFVAGKESADDEPESESPAVEVKKSGKPKSRSRENRSQEREVGKGEVKKSGKPKSRLRESRSQDFGKAECNNTEYNKTEYNDTEFNKKDLSLSFNLISSYLASPAFARGKDGREDEKRNDVIGTREKIKRNIEYPLMVEQYGKETIDGIVALITETVCTGNKTIVVAGDRFSAGYVADRLASVTSGHVQYVLNALKENKTDVRNIKKYTLAALFNAPVTIDGYYDALVRRDADAYHRRE